MELESELHGASELPIWIGLTRVATLHGEGELQVRERELARHSIIWARLAQSGSQMPSVHVSMISPVSKK
jgi:hypothetical protein